MDEKSIIGVDMGGTKLHIGVVQGNRVLMQHKVDVNARESETYIINQIKDGIEEFFSEDISGIGMGVPSLVDVQAGIVYDVQNIPSWKKVAIKDALESHFNVPVYVNNDANCFAVGEKYFGKGRPYNHLVGLTLGTGLGGGVVINGHLISGPNCGVGEFGCLPYLDGIVENYCSGQFFKKYYQSDGKTLYEQALNHDDQAREAFRQFGTHLGTAIHSVLYSVDPEAIILGGSVSKAFDFFQETMWAKVREFPYGNTLKNLIIEPSEEANIAILGAAALYYDAQPVAAAT